MNLDSEQSFQTIQRKRENWTTVFRLVIVLIWLGFCSFGLFPVTISIALPIVAVVYGAVSVFVCFRYGLNRLWITGLIIIDVLLVSLVTGALGALSSYMPLLYAVIIVGHMCGSGRTSGRTATAISIAAGIALLVGEAVGFPGYHAMGIQVGPRQDSGTYLSAAVILVIGLFTIGFFLDMTISLLEGYAGQERLIREREVQSARQSADLQRRSEQTYRLEALGTLAGGIAHDFNNLLTGILVYMQELRTSMAKDDPRYSDMTDVINAASRASDLSTQLLTFGRRQILRPRVLDLRQMLTDFHRMVSRIIGENITFSLELAPELRHIRVDEGQVEQLVMNLVLNARDAMPAGGSLIVEAVNCNAEELSRRGLHADSGATSYVRISVKDSGAGIDDSIRDRIFEPFFTTKQDGLGSGLGLPMVYGIVQQHGGAIDIDSAAGSGCTIHVYFPASDELPAPVDDLNSTVQTVSAQMILLVEDEPVVRRGVSRVLKSAGYSVLEASCAEEALSIMQQQGEQVSAVLTDVVMPGMSGRDLATALKKKHPELPILLMSGYEENTTGSIRIEPTDDSFIPKPFDRDSLLNALQRLRQRS